MSSKTNSMNKPYFAKYLPVEGEIKESPLWDKKMNKARVFDISTPEKLQLFHKVMTVDNYQPVKLFICSRDNPDKPIGEISEKAKFVKENDSFSREDLLANGVGVNWNEKGSNYKFKVKCPCCDTFM